MKRLVLSLALVLVLLAPSAIRPSIAAAESICSNALVLLSSITLLGLICIVQEAPFTESTGGGCLIGNVAASAKITKENGRADSFSYTLPAPCGDLTVQASYAFKGGEAQERITGNGRTIRALWYCSDNPWIFPDSEMPNCSRIAISMVGNEAGFDAGAASQATFPLSASVLASTSRRILNGQLQNALKQAEAQQAAQNAPAPAPAPAPKPVTPPQVSPYVGLRIGSTGSEYVTAAQFLLRHHGADIVIDGDFGGQTEDAVKAFQQANGITPNGQVSLTTWEKLWVTIGIGAQGDAVSAAQTLLNRHGFEVPVDGDFGPVTRDAVRAFQQEKGLIVGGVIDEKIWRALIAPTPIAP